MAISKRLVLATLFILCARPVAAQNVNSPTGCAGASVNQTNYTNISLTTNTQIISGIASQKIYICHVNLVVSKPTNLAIVEGTGSTCGTGTAGVFGGSTAATGWNFGSNGGIATGNGVNVLRRTATAADNVCILTSSNGQVSGLIVWSSF